MSRFETDNSLRVYLREISKTELLTAEEEIKLAARIKKGDAKAREPIQHTNCLNSAPVRLFLLDVDRGSTGR